MKNLILALLLTVISIVTYGQTYTYKAVKYATSLQGSEWSEIKDTDILTTIDLDEKKVSIYSDSIQIYSIFATQSYKVDDSDLIVISCLNAAGKQCELWLTLKTDLITLVLFSNDYAIAYTLIKYGRL